MIGTTDAHHPARVLDTLTDIMPVVSVLPKMLKPFFLIGVLNGEQEGNVLKLSYYSSITKHCSSSFKTDLHRFFSCIL